MNVFSFSAVATRIGPRSWTCSTCRNQLVRSKPFRPLSARSFASGKGSRGNNGPRRAPRIALYASAGTAAIGASAFALVDDIKTGYEAAERAGRVASTLMICINEYVTVILWRIGPGLISRQLPDDIECEGDDNGRKRAECALGSLSQAMRRSNLSGNGEERRHIHQVGTALGRSLI